MAFRHHVQRDFSGGEVSPDLLFRDDLALHAKSLAEMVNFMPLLQGPAVRTPGTRFILEVAGNPSTARIIPYITPGGVQALVLMTPKVGGTLGDLEILENISGSAESPAQLLTYAEANANSSFKDGFSGWDAAPIQYVSQKNSSLLGWNFEDDILTCRLRRGHDIPNSDPLTATLSQVFIPSETTDHIAINPNFNYQANNGKGNGKNYGIAVVVNVGTTVGASDIGTFTASNMQIAGPAYDDIQIVPGTFTVDVPYYITLTVSALSGPGGDGNAFSAPVVQVNRLQVLAEVAASIEGTSLAEVVPYNAAQIKDVHYVQSPYTATGILGHGAGKELVMTQGGIEPMRLYVNSDPVYTFEAIFSDDLTQFYEQWDWGVSGYPSACSSFNGRLVLAGSLDGSVSSPNGSNSESVWCTKVGDWGAFSDPEREEILATDSVNFSTIYRSPIRWVVGQNTLIVGAESMEYTATADIIFQPGDLGVDRQSTHGSNRVQPVPMGKNVFFPAEAGTRLRAAQFNAEAEQTWVADDLTLTHPRLLKSGIVRLVRMRNPHQMVVAVMGNGQLALLSYDQTAQVTAWSRLDVGGSVIDAAVLINPGNVFSKGGDDVLYVLVKRVIDGAEKLYVEAIVDWQVNANWTYMNSYVKKLVATPTNVIDGLDHLENKYVQVIADKNYLGTYQVSGGEVVLTDQLGEDINFTSAVAGLPAPCRIKTLPVQSGDPGSKKRYTSLTVETLGSTRPIINGERPQDRTPSTPLGKSQYGDFIGVNKVVVSGSDEYQQITVEENVPLRVAITRIYGKITEDSV